MKAPGPVFRRRRSPQGNAAYSLTELLITMGVMLFVMAGILATHMFGLRLFELTKAKLGASDDARGAISRLICEIRAAKLIRIGRGTLTGFTEAEPNTPQVGSALQIYPTADTNQFVRYYWDPADRRLKRTDSQASTVSIVANSISNETVFTSENFAGTILTNAQNNRVIGLNLNFYQLQYPVATIGPGNYFDFYQLRTKVTRRALE